MPVVHVRNVAGGVNTDLSPFDLPVGTWSWGSNVRFRNNCVTRAPVLRSAHTSLLYTSPRFMVAEFPSSGFDSLFLGYLNGRVTSLSAGSETDVSVSGYTNSNSEDVFTAAFLGDVQYINRGDRSPWCLLPASPTAFQVLPNWAPVSSPWTCNLLRASNSALIALGVTQNGTFYPNMVITSEFALDQNAPSTWNYTLGTNNATQNILDQMKGPITDAAPLGDVMIIYGETETWLMQLSGDDNIWSYSPLFSDIGAINANCSVEVDKKHYVFGLTDIWVHDGNSKASIADGKVREFIYGSLDVTNASRCAVTYNPYLKELNFRYMSQDQYCYFTGADGCNRQATYHIPSGTWSFDDLPFIFGATMANMDSIWDWANVPGTWATIGGTWAQQSDSEKRVMAMFGDANSSYSLAESVYAFDLEGPGSLAAFPVDQNATQGWTLIRDGLDLHELGANLRSYDVVNSIYPQARLEPNAQPIQFQFGSADYFNETPQMVGGTSMTYDGNFLYRLDYNAAGRYLFMEITHDDYHWVQFSGLDLDLDVTGDF